MATTTRSAQAFIVVGLVLSVILLFFTVAGHIWNIGYVGNDGWSFYVGRGYVEYGVGWGWIRRRMFHVGGPELGWTFKRALPTWSYDSQYANWRYPTWLCFVVTASVTLWIWKRTKPWSWPKPRYVVAVVVWGGGTFCFFYVVTYQLALNDFLINDYRATTSILLAALIVLPPVLIVQAIERLVRRLRIPQGHCRNCRYNLTGNVSSICPECGTRIQEEFTQT